MDIIGVAFVLGAMLFGIALYVEFFSSPKTITLGKDEEVTFTSAFPMNLRRVSIEEKSGNEREIYFELTLWRGLRREQRVCYIVVGKNLQVLSAHECVSSPQNLLPGSYVLKLDPAEESPQDVSIVHTIYA